MSTPFYVAPEQVMKDRADYARKGIARGRAAVAVIYADGVALVAENPSNTLRKVSEIYDRIAFAGSTSSAWPGFAPPTSRGTSTPVRTSTPAASPTSTPRSSARCSPTR